MTLNERIRECRRLMVEACARADRQTHYGYLAESLGLADAATGRPCNPLQVSERYQRRYERGFQDGTTLLMLQDASPLSIANHEIEEPEGECDHHDDEHCRCEECVTEHIDFIADMEIDERRTH